MTTSQKVIGAIAGLALIIGLTALVGGNTPTSTTTIIEKGSSENVGGLNRFPNSNISARGFGFLLDSNGNGTTTEAYTDRRSGTLSSDERINTIVNDSGGTRFVDFVSLDTVATTSSGFYVYVFSTSTAPGAAYDYTRINARDDMPMSIKWLFGTSTLATSTNSILAASKPLITTTNATVDRADGSGVIAWKAGDTLVFFKQAVNAATCVVSPCTTATSSGGTAFDWAIHYYSTTTPSQ